MHSRGLVKGRLIFVIVAPSVVSATEGVELIVPCLDGSSDVFDELANGYVRAKSGSNIRDRVDKALMWHSTAP